MEELAQEYQRTLKQVQKKLREISKTLEDGESNPDYTALSAAASDIRYILDWIAKAKQPESRREITSRSKLQREKLMDPQSEQFQSLVATRRQMSKLTDEERQLLDDLLAILTPRERDALVMVKGAGLSYQEAAEQLGYKSKGSIERLIKRAEQKFIFVVRKPPYSEGVFYLQRSIFA